MTTGSQPSQSSRRSNRSGPSVNVTDSGIKLGGIDVGGNKGSITIGADGKIDGKISLGIISGNINSDGKLGGEISLGVVTGKVGAEGTLGIKLGGQLGLGIGGTYGIEFGPGGEIISQTAGLGIGIIGYETKEEGCTRTISITMLGGTVYTEIEQLPHCELPPPPPSEPPPPTPPGGELPPVPPPFIDSCPATSSKVGWCLYEIEFETQTITYWPSSTVNIDGYWYGGGFGETPPMVFKHTEKGKYKRWFKNASKLKKDTYPLSNPTEYTTSEAYGGSVDGEQMIYVCADNEAVYRSGFETRPAPMDVRYYGDRPGKYTISKFDYLYTRRRISGSYWYNQMYKTTYIETFYDITNNIYTGPDYSYRVSNYGNATYDTSPVYFPEDLVMNKNYERVAYHYETKKQTVKVNIIYGSCESDDIDPPSPPPPPPKNDPPPPPPPRNMCCNGIFQLQRSQYALMRMVRNMHDVLNPDDVKKSSVPKRWLYPGASGKEKIKDYPGLFRAVMLQADMNGFVPFEVKIKDTNAAQKGNQGLNLKFNNLSASLKEITQYLIDTEGDVDAANNGIVRLAYTVGLIQQALAVQGQKLLNIEEFLGYEVQQEKATLPMLFNVLAGTTDGKKKKLDDNTEEATEDLMAELFQQVEFPIDIVKNVGRKDLNEYLLELLNVMQASNRGRQI